MTIPSSEEIDFDRRGLLRAAAITGAVAQFGPSAIRSARVGRYDRKWR
jgi:hypothetical protein